MGMKMDSPINDRHNLGASHFIAISGIHMLVIAQPVDLGNTTPTSEYYLLTQLPFPPS